MSTSVSLPHTRSIFGPLMLIAAGGLWLMSTFGLIAPGSLWAVLRFWPLLLIALGLDALLRWRWPLLANVADVIFVGLAVAAIIFAPRLGLSSSGGGMEWMPSLWMGGRAGSGHVITEERAVSGFDGVAFSSFGSLTIVPGAQAALTIEAEDDVMRHLRTDVRGSTLHIGYDERGDWNERVHPTRPVQFTLTVPNLASIDLSGAGNITVDGLSADRLEAHLSGAGNLTFRELEAETFVCDLSGAGSLNAAGTADHLRVVMSGVAGFHGAELRAASADVVLSGTGSATVWATAQLNATLSGVGSVTYYGQPVVNKTVSGLGTVRSAGDK